MHLKKHVNLKHGEDYIQALSLESDFKDPDDPAPCEVTTEDTVMVKEEPIASHT